VIKVVYLFDIWSIIPIDSTEAMSSYSAILFIILSMVCLLLYKQNYRLKINLSKKEEELRRHTNIEAGKLNKKIEKTLANNGNDLKELKNIINHMAKTIVGFTVDMKYMSKTIDEVKNTIEIMRNAKK